MTRTWSSSPRRFNIFVLLSCLIFSSYSVSTAVASRGGVEDPSNRFAIGFTYKDGTTPSVCSGTLIAPTIIATARHCVRSESGVDGTDYIFTDPGARLDGPGSTAKISRVALSDEDLAFIVLDIPLKGASYLTIADMATIAALTDSTPLFGHGYGAVFESSSPYSPLVRKYALEWRSSGKDSKLTNTFELTSSSATACVGDSGGPITTTTTNGDEVLVAIVTSAANVESACGTQGLDGLYRMRATLIHPYLSLVPEYTGVPAAEPSPKPSKKIVKITCVKGKVTKVVSGVKPKCPKGYVLKKK